MSVVLDLRRDQVALIRCVFGLKPLTEVRGFRPTAAVIKKEINTYAFKQRKVLISFFKQIFLTHQPVTIHVQSFL